MLNYQRDPEGSFQGGLTGWSRWSPRCFQGDRQLQRDRKAGKASWRGDIHRGDDWREAKHGMNMRMMRIRIRMRTRTRTRMMMMMINDDDDDDDNCHAWWWRASPSQVTIRILCQIGNVLEGAMAGQRGGPTCRDASKLPLQLVWVWGENDGQASSVLGFLGALVSEKQDITGPTGPTGQNTLWLFNIAMENGPFTDGLPIKNGDFPWLC